MSSSARITDVQALRAFRPALIKFGEESQSAIMSVGSNAAQLLGSLQRERLPHWKREIRIRSEEAVRANTKLIQQTSSETPRPSVDARKAYELAKRRVREAEEKYEHTRRAIRTLEKEISQYRTSIQSMASIARSSMPKAVGRIDGTMTALERYLATESPTEDMSSTATTPDPTRSDSDSQARRPQ
ncbi:MAG: hypothetical protein AB8F26_08125 [Phycisphaerales bacterium]